MQSDVTDRLQKREDERVRKVQERKKLTESGINPRESAEQFWTQFQQWRSCMLQMMFLFDIQAFLASLSSFHECTDDKQERLAELQSKLSSSAYFLSAYDLRSMNTAIKTLHKELGDIRDKLSPRKRFKFTRECKRAEDAEQEVEVKEAEDEAEQFVIDPSRSFSNQRDTVLVAKLHEMSVGDFQLVDLVNCDIVLSGEVTALHIRRLHNCRVFAAPVNGSILLHECTDCVFMIRIHDSKNCTFALYIKSHPIIEHCSDMVFAPLNTEHIKDISKFTDSENKYGDVDDFRWHRMTKSPNWTSVSTPYDIPSNILEHLT